MKDVTLLQTVLSYTQRGWHVFPLQPRSKVPATPHGVKDAATNVDQIQKWWTDNPDYNVGIACGKASNILVIDEDNKDATDPIYVFCRAETGGIPAIWVMDSDGRNPRMLTKGLDGAGADHPRWLPTASGTGKNSDHPEKDPV